MTMSSSEIASDGVCVDHPILVIGAKATYKTEGKRIKFIINCRNFYRYCFEINNLPGYVLNINKDHRAIILAKKDLYYGHPLKLCEYGLIDDSTYPCTLLIKSHVDLTNSSIKFLTSHGTRFSINESFILSDSNRSIPITPRDPHSRGDPISNYISQFTRIGGCFENREILVDLDISSVASYRNKLVLRNKRNRDDTITLSPQRKGLTGFYWFVNNNDGVIDSEYSHYFRNYKNNYNLQKIGIRVYGSDHSFVQLVKSYDVFVLDTHLYEHVDGIAFSGICCYHQSILEDKPIYFNVDKKMFVVYTPDCEVEYAVSDVMIFDANIEYSIL